MKKPSRLVQFGLSFIAILLTAGVVYADQGVYFDASVGQVSVDNFPGNVSIDDEATAYKAGVGFDFGNNIAVEGSYLNWGDFDGVSINGDAKGELDGGTLSGLFKLPLTDNLLATARVGVFFWESQLSAPGFRQTTEGEDLFYGVGLKARVSDQLSFNGEWQRYEFDNEEADILFVGASFRF